MSTPEGRSRALTAAIAAIEAELAELAELDSRRAELERRRAALREEAGATVPASGPVRPAANVGSSALDARDEFALFRSLFRGREDVFPRLWVNAKTGKKGYAPACRNEWVRGICDEPRVCCGDCPAQAFVPVSDEVVLDHLRGRHVVGCYPLLLDETCWFVAVDFDKAHWQADVTAFALTCSDLGLPVTVERSRSGNGAHAWFFFSAPVKASSARRMASYLLTETRARRHEQPMVSSPAFGPSRTRMTTPSSDPGVHCPGSPAHDRFEAHAPRRSVPSLLSASSSRDRASTPRSSTRSSDWRPFGMPSSPRSRTSASRRL